MHLRKSSFRLILYACVFQLKDHVVLYSEYTDPDYKTMVFYSAPLLCLSEGHFSNRSPGLMLRKKQYGSGTVIVTPTVKVPFEATVGLEGHSLVECALKSNKVSN